MESKTAMQELIKWMDDNKSHCTYGTILGKATELLAKERQDIIDAFDDGQEDMIKFDQRRSPENYFTQKYKQQ